MNSVLVVLAAIVMVVLLVAVLLLKKRTAAKKAVQADAVEPPEIAVQARDAVLAAASPAERDAVVEAVAPPAEEVSGVRPPESTVPGAASVGLETAIPSAAREDESVLAESASSENETAKGFAETAVVPEGREPLPFEQDEVAEQLIAAQPEETKEEEAVPVMEAITPVAVVVPEADAAAAEPAVVPQPLGAADARVFPEEAVDSAPEVGALPKVSLPIETYSARLNLLEEQQRALLAQAMQQRDDKLRDQLQRELVLMNDKLALLADSYDAEMGCYQQILEALERLQGEGDGVERAAAMEALEKGEPQAAETFFARLSEQQNPFAAQAAFHSGQLAECRVDLQNALHRFRRAVELEPENPQYLLAAGKTARSMYRYQEALAWLESLVELSRGPKEMNPVDQALAQGELAYTYLLSGQHQKAGPLYKESMTVLAKILGQDHPELATSWYQLGELQETLGEYDKAVSLYKKSLAILEQKRGPDHPVLANILNKLAALCMELEMEKQAVPLYERLVRIREKALRPTHPQLALSLNNLAESYRLQGQYAEAETCYLKSLAINETLHGLEHPSVGAVLQELAKLCFSQRKPEEGEQYQQRASAIFQKSVEASEKRNGKESLTLEI
jgi:tetratricopeptide (TPR) repeat protein